MKHSGRFNLKVKNWRDDFKEDETESRLVHIPVDLTGKMCTGNSIKIKIFSIKIFYPNQILIK